MNKPRLLDLYCRKGGCTKGYQRAGFYVVGVDIDPQPGYCGDEFYQSDAIDFLRQHGHEFDAIHASPPCQNYSWAAAKSRKLGKVYPDLVAPTREALIATGKPYVIENVIGAPVMGITLCGVMFGLKVIRHRKFESNILLLQPSHIDHGGSVPEGDFVTVAGHGGDGRASLALWQEAMGIDWMTKDDITQAIPPAYTTFIGAQLLQTL